MKILVITGASKGIGKATAEKFLLDGYLVINLSRTPCPLEKVTNLKIDLGSSDLSSVLKKNLGELLHKPKDEQGQQKEKTEIVLVHNAAMLENDRAQDTPESSFRQVMDVNLLAPHLLNQMLIPIMAPGSSIIYIGSTLAEKAVPDSYTYTISKHAMIGMMKASCQDLSGTSIHTACVCPGFTNTEMLREHVGDDTETLNTISALSTFGRLIEPEEIANTIHFAASNPVINGAVLHANLGQIES